MVASNEERIGILEAGMADMRADVGEIKRDVRSVREDLAGRPAWSVVALITLLSSACVGLTVALASGIG